MKIPSQRFFFLLPLLLTVVLIIFGEALGDLWKEDVKALFQQNKWLLLAFVGLLALVGLLWDRRQNKENTVPETVDKDQYDEAFAEFRKNLLEQYQTRLNSKTGRRLPVNLAAKSTDYGFDPDRAKVFLNKKTIESANIASEIDKILNDNGRLLLIGDPGAGKTTILLYAALNILNTSYSSNDSKSSDELQKLPLILNLATWNGGQGFADWYAQNIAHTYSLSPVFVRELLRRNAIVPFFDGFDEVAEEHRDDCFRKMAADFGDDKRKQLIVSSRKKEYAAARADAPVYAEIEVLPLSLAQIKKALSENAESQAADGALLHAIEHDKWLSEAVETPFYLNTASFLFGKGQRTLADFPFRADSTEGRQAELVEIFVAEQVPEERDRKYLSFLAGKMEEESFLVFELVKMQPGWGNKKWLNRFLGLEKIETEDIQVWSWAALKKSWVFVLQMGSVMGVIGALSVGLVFWSFTHIIFIMALTTFLGIILGVIMTGKVVSHFLYLCYPYQRFWSTLKGNFWIIPIAILLFVSFEIFKSIPEGDFISISHSFWRWRFFSKVGSTVFFLILVSLLPLANSGFFSHFSLRLVLYLEHKMPLRVVTFMDRMTDQHIFEDNRRTDKKGRKRRGATWRFRHKILQDYFAGKKLIFVPK